MKPIKNYILLVDSHKHHKHNTAGRYRVCAKTPKEAVELLRDKIGFGSIQVYYECQPNDIKLTEYKAVVREIAVEENGKLTIKFVDPIHATASRSK